MMEDDTAIMAAAVTQAQPRPLPPPRAARRGFFGFLKDGVQVTTRNRGVFLPLAAVHAARSLAMFAARIVALRYLGLTLGPNADVEDGLPLLAVLDKLLDGHWWLLPAAAAFLVADMANMVLGLAIKVATVCAAAASIEGGPGRITTLTLASLTGEMRRNLHGSTETAVLVQVVFLAVLACGLAVPAALAAFDAYVCPIPGELVPLLVHLVATPLVFVYCTVPREVAAVVSVAEPGMRGAGAFRHARRLTRGAKKVAQVALLRMLSRVLNKNVWRMYYAVMARLPLSIAASTFRLDAVVVYLLVAAVEVLYTATVTAYYFDCKRTEEEKAAGHIHMD